MADAISRSTDSAVNKKRATPAGSLSASSSINGSNNKRQRLDSRRHTQEKSSTADFISLDFSEGEGEGEEEPETTSKSASVADENEDAEEGETKEKTSKKKKRHRSKKKRKDKELDVQGVRVEEKPGQLNLTGRGDPSDEESSTKAPSKNGHSDSKDSENESEEEEDKDSSTRRALRAKMTNGTQIPEGEIERNLKPVETEVVTVAELETDNANLNSSNLSIEDPKDAISVAEDEATIAARQKAKVKKEKRRVRGAAKKALREKEKLDLSNLKGPEVIGISSDENDEGLEINLDMDIIDLEEQQDQLSGEQAGLQVKNESGGEEGEVDEDNGEANEAEVEPSVDDDDDGNDDDNDDNNDDGNDDKDNDEDEDEDDSPLLDSVTAIKQRKYYTAFVLPPFEHEESRAYFSVVKNPNFKIDLVREKKAAAPHKIKASMRICDVCTKPGHTEDKCELLKCKHCEKWNEHFSHACPDAPRKDEISRVKDLWRRIPTHLHEATPLSKLRIACYYCAGIDHFGDDCPRIPPFSIPGSFSLTDINTCSYASQEWLLTFSDKLDDIESGKTTVKFAPAGTKETITPAPDPLGDLRKLDEAPKVRVPERNSGGGRDNDNTYRPDRGPRGAPRAPNPYRARSPVRSEVFDRYREPPPPPRQPHGLPPRPRSRSPPRRGGPPSWDRSGDYRDRPARSGGRGGYSGGAGRAYESRAQPPLPNEAPPRGGGDRGGGGRENYRPMPSSAKENWRRYKT